jgi:GT2 family glycosyltransferase
LVINWNGREHLTYSLPSIVAQDYSVFEIMVVDNASTDGSVQEVETNFPSVSILKNPRNLGYTGAANIGVQYACERNFDFVFVMTNDVVLDHRCLSLLVQVIQDKPDVAMVGVNLIGAYSYVPIENFQCASKEWSELLCSTTAYVEGAAFFADPKLIIRIGGWDEMLFMYGDENDLEQRLVRSGYRLLRANIPAWHNAGENVMGKRKLRAAFYALRNTLVLWTKHHGFRYMLRGLVSMLRQAGASFRHNSKIDIMQSRSLPSNIFVNFAVLVVAILSYLFNIGAVLRRREIDIQRIREEHTHLERVLDRRNDT